MPSEFIDNEWEDEKQFSPMSVFAVLFGLVGLFAIYSQNILLVCFVALMLGAIVVLLAKAWNLSRFSVALGTFAIILAIFPSSWTLTNSYLERQRLIDHARKFAMDYFALLGAGKIDEAYRLSASQRSSLYGSKAAVGTAPSSMYETLTNRDQEREAYLSRAGIHDSVYRGDQVKWTFVGVSKYQVESTSKFIGLSFQDRSLPNPLTLNMMLVREEPLEEKPNEFLWYVAQTEWEKQ